MLFRSERKVQYADSREVEAAVLERFPPKIALIKSEEGYQVNEYIEYLDKRKPRTHKA